MPLIHRYEQALGIRLWRWGFFQIEIWVCAPGYRIKPHSHPDEDIELVFLFGDARFFRQQWISKVMPFPPEEFHAQFPRHFGRRFSIRRGVVHWFEVSKHWLVFLNCERWTRKPTSAAEDLKPI